MHIIAVISHFFPHIGGGETHLLQLARLFVKAGHTVTVLTLQIPGTGLVDNVDGIIIRRFYNGNEEEGYISILEFIKNVNIDNQDVVMYCYLNVGTSNLRTEIVSDILSCARQRKIPRVIRITSSHRVSKLPLVCRQAIHELQLSSGIIALNPGIYQELIDIGVHSSKIYSIPNGVDTKLFFKPSLNLKRDLRLRLGIPEDRTVFFSPSRFDPKKGIDRLLEAWAKLGAKNTEKFLELIILGSDPYSRPLAALSTVFRDYIAKIEAINVRMLPAVAHKDIVPYFQLADAYITFTSHEGMSNAMLEAMACGLTIIAPAIDAVKPLIADTWNGFLFVPDDEESALHAINRFIECKMNERKMIGERNEVLIQSNYSIRRVFVDFSRLFLEALGNQ